MIIPSIFIEGDYKKHFSINLDTGLWRCFKSGEVGNFIKFYSIVEKLPYRRAYEKFLFEEFLHEDEDVKPDEVITQVGFDFDRLQLIHPECSVGHLDDPILLKAIITLHERNVLKFPFYLCKSGFYQDRLIIPYFNSKGEMFYFQARSLTGKEPKYLNAKNYKSSHVLYPFQYDSEQPLYITEGVFDCLSLRNLGLNATTTLSCNCSTEQMEQLKTYPGPLVVAYDNDEAGMKGTRQFMRMARKAKRSRLFFCFPPKRVKDWNALYSGINPSMDLVPELENPIELDDLTLAVIGL